MRFTPDRSLSRRLRAAPLCWLLAAAVPALAAGCNSSFGTSICGARCTCEGCATTAQQTCVATGDANVKVASDVGCGSEMSTYLTCFESRATCIGARYSSSGCDLELKKLGNCLVSAKCTFDSSFAIHC